MKKSYALFFFLILLCCHPAQAQGNFEISLTSPLQFGSESFIAGGGLGMAYYFPSFDIVEINAKAKKRGKLSPFAVSFGIFGTYNMAGRREFEHVPLLAPAQGNATATFINHVCNTGAMVRFTSSLANDFLVPYIEASAGMRYFESALTIDADDVQAGYTDRTLYKTNGIEFGYGGGLLFHLGDQFYINTGVLFTHSEVPGKYLDTHSLRRVGTAIGYKERTLPYDIMMVRVGFTATIKSRGIPTRGNGGCGNGGGNWNFGGCGGGGGNLNIGMLKF